jgi:ABC-type transport system substrate-binding protein
MFLVVSACSSTTPTAAPTPAATPVPVATPAVTTPPVATPEVSTAPVESAAASAPAGSPAASAPAGSPAASAAAGSPAPSESAAAGSPKPQGGPPDLTTTTYPTRFVQGKTGGTVVFADWQEANLFNPYYFDQVTEANVATATQGGLITSTDDFKYAPDEATSIPTTTNGGVKAPGDGGDAVTVTWKLRDGLKWSDGTPLTCDDYSFTTDWIDDAVNTGLNIGRSGFLTDAGLQHYSDTSKIDDADKNLKVECKSATDMIWHFKEPYEGYLTLIPFPLQRAYNSKFKVADMLTGAGWSATDVVNAPVSGPFKYSLVTPGQELDLVRNDNYTDAMTGGPAYLDGLKFKWYTDADTMIAAYQGAQPEFDVATDLNDADLPKLTGLNKVVALTSLTYEFLRPNWDDKHCSLILQNLRNGNCPMSDPAMRTALQYAIDRKAINERLLGGNADLAFTNTSPNAWFYVAPAVTPAQDTKKATDALTAAGWEADASTGFLFKNLNKDFTCDGDSSAKVQTGDPASVCASFTPTTSSAHKDANEPDARIEACTTTRAVRQDTLALVSQFLNAIGIQVTISPVSPTDIFASFNESTKDEPCNLSRGNFDVAEHAFSVPLDPLSNYVVYSSKSFEPNGTNDAKVDDKGIDKDLNTVKNTVDFGVVQTAMTDFQKLFLDKNVEVPLYFRKEVYLANPKLGNFTGNPTSTGPLWNVQHWFVQP